VGVSLDFGVRRSWMLLSRRCVRLDTSNGQLRPSGLRDANLDTLLPPVSLLKLSEVRTIANMKYIKPWNTQSCDQWPWLTSSTSIVSFAPRSFVRITRIWSLSVSLQFKVVRSTRILRNLLNLHMDVQSLDVLTTYHTRLQPVRDNS
jgi:hypothetical protein